MSPPGPVARPHRVRILEKVPNSADLTQIHFRWRNDDGSEATATWAQNQDTKFTSFPKTTTYRLRFEVSNEGGMSSGAVTYQLQVAETATCTSGNMQRSNGQQRSLADY